MAHQPYTPKNFTPDESIGYLLRRTGGQLTQTLDRALAELDVTTAQMGIILRLFHGVAATAADLSCGMVVDAGGMTRMIDRLEEKDLIKRTRSKEDRRVVLIELTDKGRQLVDKLVPIVCDAMNHHLRGFSATEIAQFKDFLRRMIANT